MIGLLDRLGGARKSAPSLTSSTSVGVAAAGQNISSRPFASDIEMRSGDMTCRAAGMLLPHLKPQERRGGLMVGGVRKRGGED